MPDLPDEIARLTPRQRQVLAAIYYDGKLEREIAEEMGVARSMVAKIRAAALVKIGPYAARLSEGRKRITVKPIRLGFMNNI